MPEMYLFYTPMKPWSELHPYTSLDSQKQWQNILSGVVNSKKAKVVYLMLDMPIYLMHISWILPKYLSRIYDISSVGRLAYAKLIAVFSKLFDVED